VTSSELASNAVGADEVVNNSLTLTDIKGANVNGHINIGAGIPNGRCQTFDFTIAGAQVGEVPYVAIGQAIQEGIVMYGLRVSAVGHVEAAVCNFSGGAMTALSNFPVHVITLG
jgi:hypothetical protein